MTTNNNDISERKLAHIQLTSKSQTSVDSLDRRFNYEPLFATTSQDESQNKFLHEFRAKKFLNKEMKYPFWISSMTGGTGPARHINQNLASVCGKYQLAMALGSCRSLLESDEYFEDFNLRGLIGPQSPFWANIGIAQVDILLKQNQTKKLTDLVSKLKADGLIIHINPLQEWFQPEGDIITRPIIDILDDFLKVSDVPVIVKEVGQGMGPKSLQALMTRNFAAIEFAAFGGTNFSYMEKLRNNSNLSLHEGLTLVGHTALEMVDLSNKIIDELGAKVSCKNFIISGGLRSYLDGLQLMLRSRGNCVMGFAKPFLDQADLGLSHVDQFVQENIRGLNLASQILSSRE